MLPNTPGALFQIHKTAGVHDLRLNANSIGNLFYKLPGLAKLQASSNRKIRMMAVIMLGRCCLCLCKETQEKRGFHRKFQACKTASVWPRTDLEQSLPRTCETQEMAPCAWQGGAGSRPQMLPGGGPLFESRGSCIYITTTTTQYFKIQQYYVWFWIHLCFSVNYCRLCFQCCKPRTSKIPLRETASDFAYRWDSTSWCEESP